MKTILHLSLFRFFIVTAALAFLNAGCATPPEHSFNDDYNQSLACAPMYFIEDGGQSKFFVTVNQGKSKSGAERIFDCKRAASAVAETECKRRGWTNWNLDYVMERDQGWMHIVKAEVTPRKALEFKNGNP
jgi:hypothetical protein